LENKTLLRKEGEVNKKDKERRVKKRKE